MGPYCKYCGSRCFVPRAGKQLGTVTILATCPTGMANDFKGTGYTHLTAVNPVTGRRADLADARSLRYGEHGSRLPDYLAVQVLLAVEWDDEVIMGFVDIQQVWDVTTRKPVHV